MPVSGLIITLDADEARARGAVSALTAMPEIDLGLRRGRRLAAVAETPDPDADRAMFHRLGALDGVRFVDVAFVSLEPDAP